jgi:deoxyribodipyrimidine photo-lyase
MSGLVWFREDLRLYDNMALHFATQECAAIVAVYLFDHSFLKKHHMAACRVEFILRGLELLSADLAKLNIPLQIFELTTTAQVAPALMRIAKEINAHTLYFNRQYEIDEIRRDRAVQHHFAANNIACYSYDDQVILSPDSVKTKQGNFFKVFTPYARAWRQVFTAQPPKLLTVPRQQAVQKLKSSVVPKRIVGYSSKIDPALWPAGERYARKRLRKFIKENLFTYDQQRDFPALAGTSLLSPYLSAGMISPRECFLAALKANAGKLSSGRKGAISWMNELIWRDFYKQVLAAVPRISMSQAFQLKTEKLPWVKNKKLFAAWRQGKTGIPIIDAAMRQLNTTGWMHNRLRMITATFLAKNLRLDWREGEKYFMSQLIDGDFSANNGGWQWSASTGADALPYFRVFNPLRQSKRFDPKGDFIKKYCSELRKVSSKEIHNPQERKSLGYPEIIIDVAASQRDFIAKYKKSVLGD